uniref:NADH dehydrogenase subunit 4L n=1 Tax=Liposcelis bostrychophila TaxID=185214 RepID=A0A3Q8C9V2_LIPBO|nr:NADH dehydrogenase subunit 4L [Liposcelis bostrychophila]ATU74574.1 NADH dehydrogenase subunit 4L [Liposcelis bostrychophila]UNO31840.1 NADH dehydrogenase subunit 4L [Liposcelis bostrychophila]
MFILMWSLLFKNSILLMILNMEMIMTLVFFFLFNWKIKIVLILFLVMMVCEAIIGLIYCACWSLIHNNLKVNKLSLTKMDQSSLN